MRSDELKLQLQELKDRALSSEDTLLKEAIVLAEAAIVALDDEENYSFFDDDSMK